MATQQLPVDIDVPLTPELISQISLESQLYRQELPKCIKEFDTSDDNEYYILSKKFISEWEKMADQVSSSTAPGAEPKTVHTPGFMNAELVLEHLPDFDEFILNREAQEHSQFSLVSRRIMQIFQAYQGHRIPRLAYFSGIEKRVELHPIKFEFIFFSRSWLKRIRENQDEKLPVLKSIGYKNETVLDLLYRLVEFSKKDERNRDKQYLNNAASRVYANKEFNPDKYVEELRKDQNMLISPPGDQIRQGQMIGDLQIPENHQPILIVQLQEERWVYSFPEPLHGTGKQDRCEYCRKLAMLTHPCKCKEVEYCSEQCRDKDWKYHLKTCSIQMEEDNKDPEFNFTEKSKKGLIGLTNLGNTCYMNAALQCMQHTRELSQYFVKKHYLEEINEENPIGSKGKLVRSYAKFIQSVLTTESDVVAPAKLKYIIGKTKEMFSGYEQHDSQEFLLFMLDTLHEDLNRVKKKPYTDSVDSNGRPDYVVARESWLNYLKRNQSIVNDLMGGQYRSEVKCPDCNNISVTFDPFLIYSVPIPTTQSKMINIYLFFANYQNETIKMTLTSKNNLARELREDACKKGQVEMDYVKFFILGFNGTVREVRDDQTVDRLINEKQFNQNGEERQLFALEFLPEELMNFQFKKYLIFKFIHREDAITFKRPFPFEWNRLKGSDLYDRICEFILCLWSKRQFSEQKQKQTKMAVLKAKAREQGMFKIFACHGETKTVKEKLIFEKRTLITEETNIAELLQQNKFNVEFEVQFDKNPTFNFNSYKTHKGSDEPYDYYYGHKTGTNEIYPLEQCLDEMKKAEKLVEGNEVWCSKCEDLKLAEKKMQMYRASRYLVIQLKRFKQIGYEKSKNHAEVKFPIDLDLEGHIIDSSLPETYFMESEETQDFIKPSYWKGFDTSKQTKYKLYGVVNHHGSLGGGHYTAYARHEETWYLFDDSRIQQVKPQKIVSSSAYLLFYERVQ